MVWWIWVVIGFVLMAAETLHMGFFLIFAGISAIAVGALVRFGFAGPEWVQWLLFSTISVLSVALFRKPLLKHTRFNERKDIDTMIGETAKAMGTIEVNGRGKAELRGSTWNAVNIGARPVGNGEFCRVERVEGITIQIRPE